MSFYVEKAMAESLLFCGKVRVDFYVRIVINLVVHFPYVTLMAESRLSFIVDKLRKYK
jgi:hypothetical protein